MNEEPQGADLHTHTYFSDGLTSPKALVEEVLNKKGLGCFALTDHDSLSGIEPVFRFLKQKGFGDRPVPLRFIPGIELSLFHLPTNAAMGTVIHMVGLFPQVTEKNYEETLPEIDGIVGEHCRTRSAQRGIRDLDERVETAYDLNLDGISDRFKSAGDIISVLKDRGQEVYDKYFIEMAKEFDLIQHPIPRTYQILVDCWEELVPGSSREKIQLYIQRPDSGKRKRLSEILIREGMSEEKALERAGKLQGCLLPKPSRKGWDKSILEGLTLLKRAGAITILAHPAVDHQKNSYKDFDSEIVLPLIQEGLDGIEVYYPYDKTYRAEAIDHYNWVAERYSLIKSGGSDYHGDDRSHIGEMMLSVDRLNKLFVQT